MIIDTHCHVIAAEMTAGTVPAYWRPVVSRAGPDESLRRFYYDTVTHDRYLLADLIRYAGAERVLLGSDRPFDMGTDDPVGEVRALGLGTEEDLVVSGNATRLLGVAGG